MNGRTQMLIGLAVVALGIGIASLAFLDDEARVRRVDDLLKDPGAHVDGTYVLLGVPQPPEVPVTTATGVVPQPNPAWSNQTRSGEFWGPPEDRRFSLRTVTVQSDGDRTTWTWRNETKRLPADTTLLAPVDEISWTTSGALAFPIQEFDDGDEDLQRVWALYGGPLKDPMQPKPSQFTGRLMATLPDGSPMPEGVFLYDVQEYKAGCSSKFLPPEEKARLEESGDL